MYLAKIYLNKNVRAEKKHLNTLISKLFFSEGSFSMYSVFYHRYVSDCLMYTSYLASTKNHEAYKLAIKSYLKNLISFYANSFLVIRAIPLTSEPTTEPILFRYLATTTGTGRELKSLHACI